MFGVGVSLGILGYFGGMSLRLSYFSFFLSFFGLFFASNRPIAVDYFKNIYWKIVVMFFAVAWLLQKPFEFLFASKLITVSGVLVALVAVINKVNGVGLVEGTRVTIGRDLGSVLGDPNDLALVLMFPTAFSLSFLVSDNQTRSDRVLGFVSIVLLISAIIATQSRGGILGVLSVLVYFGYKKIKSKVMLLSLIFVITVFLVAVAGISGRQSGGLQRMALMLLLWGAFMRGMLHSVWLLIIL